MASKEFSASIRKWYVNYAPPKGGELVMLPMLPWQAYSTIGWLTDTLPSRFIGMPLNEKGCLITLQ